MKTKYRREYTEHGTLVGHCGVDSGQIMFADPCYVKDFRMEMDEEGGEFSADLKPDARGAYPFTYNGACSATCSDKQAGQLGHSTAVVMTSGWGDGCYPVYVKYGSDGRVESATIVFGGDSDSDYEEDEED
jgi:hypothetical protein